MQLDCFLHGSSILLIGCDDVRRGGMWRLGLVRKAHIDEYVCYE